MHPPFVSESFLILPHWITLGSPMWQDEERLRDKRWVSALQSSAAKNRMNEQMAIAKLQGTKPRPLPIIPWGERPALKCPPQNKFFQKHNDLCFLFVCFVQNMLVEITKKPLHASNRSIRGLMTKTYVFFLFSANQQHIQVESYG